jgi:tetratricopeptide (TPR) repeat protein
MTTCSTLRNRAAAYFVILLVTFAAALPAPLHAQPADIQRIFAQYQKSYQAADYPAALAAAEKLEAAIKARLGTGHVWYATALTALANVQDALDQVDEAEELYKRALAIMERSHGVFRRAILTP